MGQETTGTDGVEMRHYPGKLFLFFFLPGQLFNNCQVSKSLQIYAVIAPTSSDSELVHTLTLILSICPETQLPNAAANKDSDYDTLIRCQEDRLIWVDLVCLK